MSRPAEIAELVCDMCGISLSATAAGAPVPLRAPGASFDGDGRAVVFSARDKGGAVAIVLACGDAGAAARTLEVGHALVLQNMDTAAEESAADALWDAYASRLPEAPAGDAPGARGRVRVVLTAGIGGKKVAAAAAEAFDRCVSQQKSGAERAESVWEAAKAALASSARKVKANPLLRRPADRVAQQFVWNTSTFEPALHSRFVVPPTPLRSLAQAAGGDAVVARGRVVRVSAEAARAPLAPLPAGNGRGDGGGGASEELLEDGAHKLRVSIVLEDEGHTRAFRAGGAMLADVLASGGRTTPRKRRKVADGGCQADGASDAEAAAGALRDSFMGRSVRVLSSGLRNGGGRVDRMVLEEH